METTRVRVTENLFNGAEMAATTEATRREYNSFVGRVGTIASQFLFFYNVVLDEPAIGSDGELYGTEDNPMVLFEGEFEELS